MCYYHPDEILKYICLTCNKQPICSDCLVDGELHSGHKINKVKTEDIVDMVIGLKDKLYPSIDKLLLENNKIKDECIKKIEESEIEKNKNSKIINQQFKHIIRFVQMSENDLDNQNKNNHDRNLNIQKELFELLENQNKNLNSIISSNNNKNIKDEDNEIILKDYQYLTFFINETNNYNKLKKDELLNQINCKPIIFHQNRISRLKESLNQLHSYKLQDIVVYITEFSNFENIYQSFEKTLVNCKLEKLPQDITNFNKNSLIIYTNFSTQSCSFTLPLDIINNIINLYGLKKNKLIYNMVPIINVSFISGKELPLTNVPKKLCQSLTISCDFKKEFSLSENKSSINTIQSFIDILCTNTGIENNNNKIK